MPHDLEDMEKAAAAALEEMSFALMTAIRSQDDATYDTTMERLRSFESDITVPQACRAQARNLVRMAFGGYLAAPVYNKFLAWCGFPEEANAIAAGFARRDREAVATAIHDGLIDRIAIIGTPDECREQLAGFVAAGVTTPVLAPIATSPEQAVRVFETFAPART